MSAQLENFTKEEEERGQKFLNAIERVLASPEEIIDKANAMYEKVRATERITDHGTVRRRACDLLISDYADKTAIGGAASALPAMIPGIGTLTAVLGGGLADMVVCIKYETEMIMALSHLHGNNIKTEDERRLCLLLAGLSTYSDLAGDNAVVDYASVAGQALWNYAPRQMSKLLTSIFVHLAITIATRGLLKAIPIAGAVTAYALNKMLTKKAGNRARVELEHRAERG